jgi:hypothetical protein
VLTSSSRPCFVSQVSLKKNLHNFALISFLVLLLAVLSACSSGKPQETDQQSTLHHAYGLIDEGKPTEAIDLLESYLKNADDTDIRIALASAYVAKAGLPIQKFYQFAKSISELQPSASDFFESHSVVNRLSESASAADSSASEILMNRWVYAVEVFSVGVKVFDSLPDVAPEQEADLDQAISILEQIKAMTHGEVLYRALLRTVRLKNQLAHGRFLHDHLAKDGQTCLIDRKQLVYDVQAVLANAKAITWDLAFAFPRLQDSFTHGQDGIDQAKARLDKLSQSGMFRGTAWDLKDSFAWVKQQMGWNWTCED